jgi:hypothetical protein
MVVAQSSCRIALYGIKTPPAAARTWLGDARVVPVRSGPLRVVRAGGGPCEGGADLTGRQARHAVTRRFAARVLGLGSGAEYHAAPSAGDRSRDGGAVMPLGVADAMAIGQPGHYTAASEAARTRERRRRVGHVLRCEPTHSSSFRAWSCSPNAVRSRARLPAERRVEGWSSPSTRRLRVRVSSSS